MKNPIQPLEKDKNGVIRFKSNAIVNHLLEFASERGHGMTQLAMMNFNNDDRQQFAQLIGYSLGGYCELTNYVDDYSYNVAEKMSEGMNEGQARIEYLQNELDYLRESLKEPMARLFFLNPDDFLK